MKLLRCSVRHKQQRKEYLTFELMYADIHPSPGELQIKLSN